MDHDERQKLLRNAVTKLREHFDSVQIVASRFDNDGSTRHEYGDGSWYERLGLLRSLTNRMEDSDRIEARDKDRD